MINQTITANEELFNAICNADLTIQKVYEIKNEIINLRDQASDRLKEAQLRRQTHRRNCFVYALIFTVPAIILIESISMLFDFDILRIIMSWGMKNHGFFTTWILIGLPVALIIFLLAKLIPCKYKQFLDNAAMLEANATQKSYELELFIQDNKQHISIIAPEYRYPVASKELVRIFQLGRASSLPEAYDKLELKLHQLKVEEGLGAIISLQIAQIGILRKIEHNTDWLYY